MATTRRDVLGGIALLTAHVVLSKRITAQSAGAVSAPPGALDLLLTAFSPGILRISISPADDPPRLGELGVLERTDSAPLLPAGRVRAQTVIWGKYSVHITDSPLRVAVYENDKLRQEVHFDVDSTDVRFPIFGPVFGMGEGVHPFDRRGTRDTMINGQHSPDLETFGSRVPIPWVISPDAWGIFIGQPSASIMDISQTEARFRNNEATSTRNVYLLIGDTPADVLRSYADLTGHPHLPPLWAFGYQQSHRTLASSEEVLAIAHDFRAKKLPCDALIYLGTGFCPSGWNTGHGSFTFNDKVFPEPEKALAQMHDLNLKVILHMVPPGNLHGHLTDTGAAAQEAGDATAYWSKHAPLLKLGVDGWWPDEGDRLSVYARLERNEMYWEGGRQAQPTKRPFALHRNGYAGLQRFGWLWSGDTFSTWAALRAQIMVGINIGLSGIPWWGTDTGGFVPTVEYTPELFVRWFQFSAFCPSFRSHGRSWKLHLPWGWNLGSAEPKEVEGSWVASWPPDADLHRPDIEPICRKILELRYQLMPYLYSSAAQTRETGIPVIRALWLATPHDPKTHLIDDAYLWGDHLLVAPIATKEATARTVYLPEGQWWDYWKSEKLQGSREINATAALDSIPLFVRAGAIIPIGPVKQYTAQTSSEPTTLRIYPGADGVFTWYEDDGSSFDYEHGGYMRVACKWNDAKRSLTLTRDPSGAMHPNHPTEVELVGNPERRRLDLGDTVSEIRF